MVLESAAPLGTTGEAGPVIFELAGESTLLTAQSVEKIQKQVP